MRFQKQLDLALSALVMEDPSLRVWADKDTGQTVIAGMGELHIDIIKDRILRCRAVKLKLLDDFNEIDQIASISFQRT